MKRLKIVKKEKIALKLLYFLVGLFILLSISIILSKDLRGLDIILTDVLLLILSIILFIRRNKIKTYEYIEEVESYEELK